MTTEFHKSLKKFPAQEPRSMRNIGYVTRLIGEGFLSEGVRLPRIYQDAEVSRERQQLPCFEFQELRNIERGRTGSFPKRLFRQLWKPLSTGRR